MKNANHDLQMQFKSYIISDTPAGGIIMMHCPLCQNAAHARTSRYLA
jgi:hypothetical protein